MNFWAILAGILAIAFGLGYFLAFWPLAILTAIGAAFAWWLHADLNDGEYKGSGGIALGFTMIGVIAIVIILWIGFGVRCMGSIMPASLDDILHSVSSFLFR